MVPAIDVYVGSWGKQHLSLITTWVFTILGLQCWRLHEAILLPLWLPNAYGCGLFPAFHSTDEGEWASAAEKSASSASAYHPLHTVPHLKSKCLLTNMCNAASRPLGYSNELEGRQNHSWWVMSTGDKPEQETPNPNLDFSRPLE